MGCKDRTMSWNNSICFCEAVTFSGGEEISGMRTTEEDSDQLYEGAGGSLASERLATGNPCALPRDAG